MNKRIAILAHSRKLGGSCVAGKDKDGTWYRITKRNSGPIPLIESRKYGMLNILEVSDVILAPSNKYKYHSENVTYGNVAVAGKINTDILDKLVDEPDDIFGVGRCVSESEAQLLNESLLIVKVSNFSIYLVRNGVDKPKLRGMFTYKGVVYSNISITDTSTEECFVNITYPHQERHEEAYITISLGEIFNENAYKLISGILIPEV